MPNVRVLLELIRTVVVLRGPNIGASGPGLSASAEPAALAICPLFTGATGQESLSPNLELASCASRAIRCGIVEGQRDQCAGHEARQSVAIVAVR